MTDPQWFSTGLISSYPDLGLDDDQSEPGVRPSDVKTGCKVFRVPPADEEASAATALDEIADPAVNGGNFSNQVLVFRYRGKMHAMDHSCPHSSFSLSRGALFDIEDFGMVLSTGIRCPKHGWCFDLFTGSADHGPYQMQLWDVELRDIADSDAKEVWIRRKPCHK